MNNYDINKAWRGLLLHEVRSARNHGHGISIVADFDDPNGSTVIWRLSNERGDIRFVDRCWNKYTVDRNDDLAIEQTIDFLLMGSAQLTRVMFELDNSTATSWVTPAERQGLDRLREKLEDEDRGYQSALAEAREPGGIDPATYGR